MSFPSSYVIPNSLLDDENMSKTLKISTSQVKLLVMTRQLRTATHFYRFTMESGKPHATVSCVLSEQACKGEITSGANKGRECGRCVSADGLCGKHSDKIDGSLAAERASHLAAMDTTLALANALIASSTDANVVTVARALIAAQPLIAAYNKKQEQTKACVAKKREENKAKGLNVDGSTKFNEKTEAEQFAIFKAAQEKSAAARKAAAEKKAAAKAVPAAPAAMASKAVPAATLTAAEEEALMLPVDAAPVAPVVAPKKKVPIKKAKAADATVTTA